MARIYDVIDSDGHILEPVDLWVRYIDPKFRENCPELIRDENGQIRLKLERDRIIDTGRSMGGLGAIGAREGKIESQKIAYEEGRKGGFDPHARIVDMDAEDIDAAFLYPSVGLTIANVKDPEQAAANARAYNRWLADYCKPYPDRLFGAAMIPAQSVECGIREMRFAARELGYRSGFLPTNCNLGAGRVFHDPVFYPLWQEAQELDFAIGIHGAATEAALAGDRFPDKASHAVRHCVAHTMEMMSAATSFIMCGICDRFPKLRVAFLESGGGWMAGWLDRMDRHFDDVGMNDTGLSVGPSEIFHRQCFISFEPVERTLPLLAEFLGPTNILWATDYPHLDGFWGAPRMIKQMGLRPEIEKAVLAGGAKRFYRLD